MNEKAEGRGHVYSSTSCGTKLGFLGAPAGWTPTARTACCKALCKVSVLKFIFIPPDCINQVASSSRVGWHHSLVGSTSSRQGSFELGSEINTSSQRGGSSTSKACSCNIGNDWQRSRSCLPSSSTQSSSKFHGLVDQSARPSCDIVNANPIWGQSSCQQCKDTSASKATCLKSLKASAL